MWEWKWRNYVRFMASKLWWSIRCGNNITGKSFDSHVEALAECNLDLIKDITSFTVH